MLIVLAIALAHIQPPLYQFAILYQTPSESNSRGRERELPFQVDSNFYQQKQPMKVNCASTFESLNQKEKARNHSAFQVPSNVSR